MIQDWLIPVTIQDAAGAAQNGDPISVGGRGAVNMIVSGTFVGTITWEALIGGSTWVAIPALNRTSDVVGTTATAPGHYFISAPGIESIRARVSAWTSGSITVVARVVPYQGAPVPQLTPAGGGATEAKQNTQITAEQAIQALLGGTGSLKDNGPAWTSVHGVGSVPVTSADMTTAANISDVPTAGQKLVITDLFLSSEVETNITIRCETTDVVIAGPFFMAAGSSVQHTPRSRAWKTATANKKLQAIAADAGAVTVDVHYFSEA